MLEMKLLNGIVLVSVVIGGLHLCDGRLLNHGRNSMFDWEWDDWDFHDPWFTSPLRHVWRNPHPKRNIQRGREGPTSGHVEDWVTTASEKWDRAQEHKRQQWEAQQEAAKREYLSKVREEREEQLKQQEARQKQYARKQGEFSHTSEEWANDKSHERAEATARATCSDQSRCHTSSNTKIHSDNSRSHTPGRNKAKTEESQPIESKPIELKKINMPGFRSRDLKLQFHGDIVTVRAKREGCQQDGDCSYKKEFEYSFSLPEHVDPRTVQGRLTTDGELTLEGISNSRIPDRMSDGSSKFTTDSPPEVDRSVETETFSEDSYHVEEEDEYVTIEVQE